MEKEENWLKCLPFKPRQGKKVFVIFAAINILIIWLYLYKSSNISYFYYQSSKPVIAKTVPLPIYNVSVYHIPLLQSKDMAPFYAEVTKKAWCFLYGIDLIDSQKRKKCICLDNWFGLDCGIPSAVWKSDFLQEGKNANIEIRRREKPRRIISSFVVDDYQDILDINVYNSFSVIDLYLTIEQSNQKLSVLNRFENGQFAEWQSKIIPFQVNVSNKLEVEDTVLMLKSLWDIGWKRLSDFRPDDIFIFQRASSIITKDVLLFLKLYDGFPEPFFFELRPLLFKFSMRMKSNSTDAKLVPFRPLGCTFQFLSSMCNFEVSKLFSNNCHSQDAKSFEKNNWPLKMWTVGSIDAPSGWHCNVCCKDSCIKARQTELKSFNMPVLKLEANSSTVERFLDKLHSFDSGGLSFEKVVKSDPFYAPNVVLNNEKKYSYLVEIDEKF
ncbi:beta-1,4-mannosyl-glycoprotein 4-beta-N-acetylglucosaminyltransferase [Parasteatoda tepidariorum]|uniref:beta-1,4-mannosyl-glycoprotein 4-beta-N-acetylglucosaminyltransferase n=1 Tax=Parasteatoda tepidariorum TaxID=114398 RepID=UPI00077FAE23|nr:beta-1,4-mannosyl-glycoprotein 4-beta-N-acetylglucosaminyltransferase [Parasteatoda tepidariorum]